ncbi:helicase [Curtobacterium sp. VKM Ac-1376]|uniref:helicase n=1 Tax=Curtobacterium sp. VKM Ac-1376 TaxID=123312 RepID=UPI001889D66D|nr:helicase [Curtobacterium sp. VKM Ac-1376]MBF4613726.1 helicase [Curtobacterium sp. VKM Ac-1376]
MRRGAQDGSATVLLAAVLGVGVLIASAALAAAGHRTQAIRADGAADAAATASAAAATGLVLGEPCVVAARVTTANGATLTACELTATTARVRVRVGTGPFAVGAVAVAGPADGPPEHYVYGVPVGPWSPMSRSTRTRS